MVMVSLLMVLGVFSRVGLVVRSTRVDSRFRVSRACVFPTLSRLERERERAGKRGKEAQEKHWTYTALETTPEERKEAHVLVALPAPLL